MPSSAIAAAESQAARRRAQPIPSITDATTTSRSEIAEVSAPTTRARKKSTPITWPAGPMVAKALGSVMKSAPTVLATTSSSSPRAKSSGKTTSPATNATPKSETAIISDSSGR